METSLFKRIYRVVQTIPLGTVMTYGQVAKALGIKDTRKVGWALHANKSNEVPCHRVVNKEGKLAKNFAFNGMEEQQRRLESEGIVFRKDGYVDLVKYSM